MTLYGASSAIGVGLDYLYGADHAKIMMLLILMIVMDWVSGIASSIKNKMYRSQWGIQGVLRTLFILMFPAAAALMDNMVGTPGFIFYAITTGLIYHTFNSVVANIARSGWDKWIPKQILNMLQSEIEAKNKRYEKQTKEKNTIENETENNL